MYAAEILIFMLFNVLEELMTWIYGLQIWKLSYKMKILERYSYVIVSLVFVILVVYRRKVSSERKIERENEMEKDDG